LQDAIESDLEIAPIWNGFAQDECRVPVRADLSKAGGCSMGSFDGGGGMRTIALVGVDPHPLPQATPAAI
jgi:hypothetical protein